jgi:DNA-binding beta-propeller fold protein YncE
MNAPLKSAGLAPAASLFVALAGQTYRIERPWAKIPPDVKVGAIAAVAADSRGYVYVYHRFDPLIESIAPPPVLVFDPSGEFVTGWGGGMIKDPHHLFIDPQDRVFLVDRDAHQIRIFDTSGKHLFDIGERDKPLKPFNHPCSVATGPSGDIYVADGYGGTHVHRFASDGTHIRTWGEPGDGPSQFTTPHGIWVLADGRVLVGDRENNRVQVFDPAGAYLYEMRGTHKPMSIYAGKAGIIYVTDHIPRLVAYRSDGSYAGGCRPVLNGGHGIYGDAAGNLFISEMNPNRVTRMSPVPS